MSHEKDVLGGHKQGMERVLDGFYKASGKPLCLGCMQPMEGVDGKKNTFECVKCAQTCTIEEE